MPEQNFEQRLSQDIRIVASKAIQQQLDLQETLGQLLHQTNLAPQDLHHHALLELSSKTPMGHAVHLWDIELIHALKQQGGMPNPGSFNHAKLSVRACEGYWHKIKEQTYGATMLCSPTTTLKKVLDALGTPTPLSKFSSNDDLMIAAVSPWSLGKIMTILSAPQIAWIQQEIVDLVDVIHPWSGRPCPWDLWANEIAAVLQREPQHDRASVLVDKIRQIEHAKHTAQALENHLQTTIPLAPGRPTKM